MAIYANTQKNVKGLGLASVEEYVFGDNSLPFIFHDERAGTFKFISEEERATREARARTAKRMASDLFKKLA